MNQVRHKECLSETIFFKRDDAKNYANFLRSLGVFCRMTVLRKKEMPIKTIVRSYSRNIFKNEGNKT